jgi:transposase-like protein
VACAAESGAPWISTASPLDIPVQRRRDRRAAARFFRSLLKGEGCSPRRLFTDKLRSYPAAKREPLPSAVHDTKPYANNRAELSHQPTRERKRKMRRFKYILGQKPLFVDYNFTEGIEWESRLRPFSTAA